MKTILNLFKCNKKFISEIDRFLTQVDRQQPQKSQSQQKEIEEYQNLFYNRDIKTASGGSQ